LTSGDGSAVIPSGAAAFIDTRSNNNGTVVWHGPRGFAFPGGGQRGKEMVMMQQTIARYRDRAAAGAVLAEQLRKYAGQNVAVFGVGAGGVAVAAPIALALGADLDVLAVRQLTLPGQPDQPWGAVAVLGDCVQVVAEQDTHRRTAGEPADTVRRRDLTELRQLEDTYRAGRPPERITSRLVIVVGDGLAGLAAMRAAATAVRRHRPAQLVIALPTATTQLSRELGRVADEVICPMSAGLFQSNGSVYSDPAGISVDDVTRMLST
jgi:predicted phosphoribosyltransferase